MTPAPELVLLHLIGQDRPAAWPIRQHIQLWGRSKVKLTWTSKYTITHRHTEICLTNYDRRMKGLFTTVFMNRWSSLPSAQLLRDVYVFIFMKTRLKLRAKIDEKDTDYHSVWPKPIAVVHTIVFNSRQKRSLVESVIVALKLDVFESFIQFD